MSELDAHAERFADAEIGTGSSLTREAVRDDRLAVALNEVKGLGLRAPSASLGTAADSRSNFVRVAHFAQDDEQGHRYCEGYSGDIVLAESTRPSSRELNWIDKVSQCSTENERSGMLCVIAYRRSACVG